MEHAELLKASITKTVSSTFSDRMDMRQPQLRCMIVGQVYRSQQNGNVYDPNGIAPCICVGHHAGVEPRIIVYEDE